MRIYRFRFNDTIFGINKTLGESYEGVTVRGVRKKMWVEVGGAKRVRTLHCFLDEKTRRVPAFRRASEAPRRNIIMRKRESARGLPAAIFQL